MNYLTKPFLLVVTLILNFDLLGQQAEKIDLGQLITQNKLKVYNRAANLIKDKDHAAIKLDESRGEGIAWVQSLKFSEGIIEIDLKGQDVFQKSFLGIAFHALNDSTYDAIYFRPFNFHAKDSIRKIHAVQYISHPTHTWKKLRDEQNGKYEKAIVPVPQPDPNNWFHARIEVKGQEIRVFVNQSTIPSLTVTKLNNRKDGNIGLWVGDGSGGEFFNLALIRK